ncbi:hypothetical protein ACFE04_009462 [Oxalis oulophora]
MELTCLHLHNKHVTLHNPSFNDYASSSSYYRRRSSSIRLIRRSSSCSASSSSSSSSLKQSNSNSKNKSVVNNKKRDDNDEIELQSWMHQNGMPPCKVVIKERESNDSKHPSIHYIAASEVLKAGDVAYSVPNSLVVTLERVLGNETIAELLTTNKLSELACLALYLMYEKKQGKKSFWYPYIRELDRQRGRGQLAVESPLLWSESELDYLTGSPTKAEVLGRAEGIRREYQELDTVWFMAGSLFQQYPYDIPTEAFPFEIFKQAFVAIQSCVVHLQKVSLARRFALVPLGPPLLAYCSNCKAMLSAVDGSVELVVDRSYKAGDSIVVWCGPQPNSRLLINYGFVDEDNPYDRLMIEAALNTEDPQYQDKRMVAQRNGKLSIQVFQVQVGKEKEAVLEMLPYLRLGYVSDPSDMHSVISSQGPVCPMSPCMERAALDQLSAYFESRLAGYPTTLSEDEALLADSGLNPKRRVATQLATPVLSYFSSKKAHEDAASAGIKSLRAFAILGVGVSGFLSFASIASASDEAEHGLESPNYPWPHEGILSSYDHASIRRGHQVYTQVCASCHSVSLVSYRDLVGVAYTEEEVKAMAAEIEVTDGPNDEGEMFTRPGKPSDRFPQPYPNEAAARFANGGAYPPDLSLITKARHNGQNYVFALLTGYHDPPAGVTIREGLHYNPYFPGGAIAMPKMLNDGAVEYEDETPATEAQMGKDVVSFLSWAAEPEMEERKLMGFKWIFVLSLALLQAAYQRRLRWSPLKSRKVIVDVVN